MSAGKHMIGSMSKTNAHAAPPIGREKRPKCHGPLRKFEPTTKTRRAVGSVKAKRHTLSICQCQIISLYLYEFSNVES